jgi:hypothetical protein
VKSPPELWTQCSDPASLARHLRGFGEIKITRLEPESTVAWEGESASGTVTLEASGWGTRVRLTAALPRSEPVPEVAAEVTPLQIVSEPALAPRGLIGLIGALRRRPREVPSVAEGKAPATPAAPELAESANGPNLLDELEAALDSLGQAHHRPYSRS